jgi:hypothetical protein
MLEALTGMDLQQLLKKIPLLKDAQVKETKKKKE